MTVALAATEVAARLNEKFSGSVTAAGADGLLVKEESLLAVASFLKDEPGFEFDYLNNLTSVDYRQYFEVIYNLTSTRHNHSLTLKVRCHDKNKPSVPSVYHLWQGADFQEREIFDLMGIAFTGHPNLKRIFLWEGFEGHPLRKDYQYDA